MTQWRVRLAVKADADVLASLEKQAFGDKAWGDGALAGGLDAPHVSALLVYGSDDQEVVGFALWRSVADEAEILTFGVAPAKRKLGAGRALLQSVISRSLDAGAVALYLEVDRGNIGAIKLYEQAGFQLQSVRRAYYRNGGDAMVMRLDLSANEKSR